MAAISRGLNVLSRESVGALWHGTRIHNEELVWQEVNLPWAIRNELMEMDL